MQTLANQIAPCLGYIRNLRFTTHPHYTDEKKREEEVQRKINTCYSKLNIK